MEFLSDYGLFLAKAITIVVCLILLLSIILSFRQREQRSEKGHIEVTKLNERYRNMADTLKHAALDQDQLKQEHKAEKKKDKQEKAAKKKALKAKAPRKIETVQAVDSKEEQTDTAEPPNKKRLFVLNFKGDIKAQAADHLREEVSTVLSLATDNDEVVVLVETPGGQVHGYGLAASQLSRIKTKKIPLTVCVDKVAASGGYMMACVADKILAAPFALLGSIGVMAEMPNFHRLLKKVDIDYDVYTAGEFKRTVTTFGENTEKGKQKFREELQDVHVLFKDFIHENRPVVDIDTVATGEAWYGRHALDRKLVDEIMTSDEYITNQLESADIFEVEFVAKKSLQEKLGLPIQNAIENAFLKVIEQLQYSRFFKN